MQSMWVCVCKWGRNGLLVSQRDWPASWQVDLKSRRQSQGLVSHLSPLSFTSRNNFDTLSICLTLLAVGDLWLSFALPPFPLSSILTAAGVLHENIFTFVGWPAKLSHRAEILCLLNQLSWVRDKTQQSSCGLVLSSLTFIFILQPINACPSFCLWLLCLSPLIAHLLWLHFF